MIGMADSHQTAGVHGLESTELNSKHVSQVLSGAGDKRLEVPGSIDDDAGNMLNAMNQDGNLSFDGGDNEEQKGEELDEFFDCIDTEESTIDIFEEQKRERISPTKKEDETPKVTTSSKTRDRTSFSLLFDIKELSFTLGKLSASNKIEGIHI